MYAQTIAYGLLSARIADPRKKTIDDFAAHMRTNPFLRELMEAFLQVGGRRGRPGGLDLDFDELGVSEVVDLLDDANMEAVVLDFGDRNPQEDPVLHFYELFLKDYDAKKRMQRGVFYTPRPVVSYIVRSVDELLRVEFGLADGLADITTWGEMAKRHKGLKLPDGVSPDQDFVQVLDPATGTGTFLVEAIDLIHRTLVAKWKAAGHRSDEIDRLWNEYVPKHLLTRLHGYELLMAPYAIAHLKIGLKLFETRYRFGSDERARVYLTNALEPATDVGQQALAGFLPALAHEAAAVNGIKGRQHFTVVMGNPPYSNFGRLNRNSFILGLLGDYKRGLGEKKINLDDDFIKFIRLFQYLIERSNVGVIGVITNNAYIDGVTHRQMRRSISGFLPEVRVLDLHGSASKHERGPDGDPEENVFDIRQGVAISLLTRAPDLPSESSVFHSELWGSRAAKYRALLALSVTRTVWSVIAPAGDMCFFVPRRQAPDSTYARYWSLDALIVEAISGVQTKKDDFFIGFSETEVADRLQGFLSDPAHRDPTAGGILGPKDDWIAKKAHGVSYRPSAIRKIIVSPFDVRFVYYEPRLLGRARWQVMRHMLHDNVGLVFMRQSANYEDYDHALAVSSLVTDRVFYSANGAPFLFPLYLYPEHGEEGQGLFSMPAVRQPNISGEFVDSMLKALRKKRSAEGDISDAEHLSPEALFGYLYAVLNCPTYRLRYADLLKVDFPRIPLPGTLSIFVRLAAIGERLVALHRLSKPTSESAGPTYVGPNNPQVGRISWAAEQVSLDGPSGNTAGRFVRIPEAVWDFHVGGYRPSEKWLKDRKGRILTKNDIDHYRRLIAAIAETIGLMNEIDEVIDQHGGWPAAFSSVEPQ
jgi:predicted helicase